MMASVFLMQPLGQLFASMTGLAVLLTVGKSNNLDTITDPVAQAKIVDRIWRWVIGVGAIPAFIAIAARLTIPESPRYTLDVDQDGARALRDTRRYYGVSSPDITEQNGNTTGVEMSLANGIQAVPKATTINDDNSDDEIHDIEEPAVMYEQTVADARESMPDPFSRTELVRFFWTEGNGKYLAGTSICWFLLDFAFYGLGINNPRTIAQIWASRPAAVSHANGTAIVVPDWANPADPDMGIYDVLYNDGIRSIITVSVGSMLGSIILVKVINYVSRRSWLAWSFVGMSILFAVVGGSYFTAVNSDLHALTITLYVLCQLLFNLGPNTLTFIVGAAANEGAKCQTDELQIPAEIFPTRYRATCHGISAAAGKLGSVVVQAMLSTPAISNAPTSKSLGWILVAFSPLMMAGAFFAWAWTPEVQDGRGSEEDIGRERAEGIKGLRRLGGRQFELPNKSLEELAKGRLGVMDAERGVGFRVKGRALGARFTDAVRRRRG
jgi:PHS family inorganic phosphate transporter-like MFS transporter